MAQGKLPNDVEYRPLQRWETAVDEAVRTAQERGDFDNLPGHGKPLKLNDNPFAGDMALAFDVMQNAGLAPYWIEVDKEIRAGIEALKSLREDTARQVTALLAAHQLRRERHHSRPTETPITGRWRPFRRNPSPAPLDPDEPLRDAIAIRDRARRRYLEQAAELNQKIVDYNTYLPRELWRLERVRPSLDQYARDFDTACPPI